MTLGRSPQVVWGMVYHYTSDTCSGQNCGRCFEDILDEADRGGSAISIRPGSTPFYVRVTPNFFRFASEAVSFLVPNPKNNCLVGLYLDIQPIVSGSIKWAMTPAGHSRVHPGGALEWAMEVRPAESPVPIVEYFGTIGSSSSQTPVRRGSGSCDFHFEEH